MLPFKYASSVCELASRSYSHPSVHTHSHALSHTPLPTPQADNAIGRKFLSAYMGLSQRKVYMVDGVRRSIQRVFVAKDKVGYDAYTSEFVSVEHDEMPVLTALQVAQQTESVPLEVGRLTYVKAFQYAFARLLSRG